jgi:rRNA maturation protein Nop10
LIVVRLVPVFFAHAFWPPARSTSERSKRMTSLRSRKRIYGHVETIEKQQAYRKQSADPMPFPAHDPHARQRRAHARRVVPRWRLQSLSGPRAFLRFRAISDVCALPYDGWAVV